LYSASVNGIIIGRKREEILMADLDLVLYHIPIAWKRPGQARWGRYDLQRGVKDALGCIISSQTTLHTTFTKPVALEAEFVFPKPRSYPRYLYGLSHAKKPDLDNLLKFYLDLCKDYDVYTDDSIVVKVNASKRYIFANENPHVSLKFYEKGI
jgi:Holliday junction resolvase RusA-like endonuclease